jgi:hypothetical protein
MKLMKKLSWQQHHTHRVLDVVGYAALIPGFMGALPYLFKRIVEEERKAARLLVGVDKEASV